MISQTHAIAIKVRKKAQTKQIYIVDVTIFKCRTIKEGIVVVLILISKRHN